MLSQYRISTNEFTLAPFNVFFKFLQDSRIQGRLLIVIDGLLPDGIGTLGRIKTTSFFPILEVGPVGDYW